MDDKLKKVAENSRLEADNKLIDELEEILKLFKVIDEVDTESVEPSFQPIKVQDIFREDKVQESLDIEEVFLNVKNRENNFFKGPRVL